MVNLVNPARGILFAQSFDLPIFSDHCSCSDSDKLSHTTTVGPSSSPQNFNNYDELGVCPHVRLSILVTVACIPVCIRLRAANTSHLIIAGNNGRLQSARAEHRRSLAFQLGRGKMCRYRSAALVSAGAVTFYASHSTFLNLPL